MRFLVSYWKLCISVSLILCWLKMGTLHAEETVLMSYGGHNESIGPHWVAIDKSFYQKHGLDARPLQVPNARIKLAALGSGEGPGVVPSGGNVLVGVSGGGKIRWGAFSVRGSL